MSVDEARDLRYPATAVWGDYARAGVGLVLTAGPLLALPVAVWAAVPLAAAALLFAVFAVRTVGLHRLRLRRTGDGVTVRGLAGTVALRWADLTGVRLRFYSTRRDRRDGWFQAVLAGPGGRIRIDSRLDGFDGLMEDAVWAARRNGVALDRTTCGNLDALGIFVDDDGAAAEGAAARDAAEGERR
ncbi:hypothetical protein M2352_000684 [Azospirillum fermentarium]|uniref:PH domain-containing protein n=1 Tax=Azospirillum fermentarium TaxID=1233114 RepID=UPI0022261661|nr:PH domain-containing protein [Azospirillum fermentarium]MCW2245093.1 hypothetical protein [Azospirillum fermentarium]